MDTFTGSKEVINVYIFCVTSHFGVFPIRTIKKGHYLAIVTTPPEFWGENVTRERIWFQESYLDLKVTSVDSWIKSIISNFCVYYPHIYVIWFIEGFLTLKNELSIVTKVNRTNLTQEQWNLVSTVLSSAQLLWLLIKA